MFDLVNIFEVFLPQLLRYPNASDPLNSDAASHYLDNEETYNCKVREYVQKYASDEKHLQPSDKRNEKAENIEESRLQQQAIASMPGISVLGSAHNTLSSSDIGKEDDNEAAEMEDDFDECSSDVSDMSDLWLDD